MDSKLSILIKPQTMHGVVGKRIEPTIGFRVWGQGIVMKDGIRYKDCYNTGLGLLHGAIPSPYAQAINSCPLAALSQWYRVGPWLQNYS